MRSPRPGGSASERDRPGPPPGPHGPGPGCAPRPPAVCPAQTAAETGEGWPRRLSGRARPIVRGCGRPPAWTGPDWPRAGTEQTPWEHPARSPTSGRGSGHAGCPASLAQSSTRARWMLLTGEAATDGDSSASAAGHRPRVSHASRRTVRPARGAGGREVPVRRRRDELPRATAAGGPSRARKRHAESQRVGAERPGTSASRPQGPVSASASSRHAPSRPLRRSRSARRVRTGAGPRALPCVRIRSPLLGQSTLKRRREQHSCSKLRVIPLEMLLALRYLLAYSVK